MSKNEDIWERFRQRKKNKLVNEKCECRKVKQAYLKMSLNNNKNNPGKYEKY